MPFVDIDIPTSDFMDSVMSNGQSSASPAIISGIYVEPADACNVDLPLYKTCGKPDSLRADPTIYQHVYNIFTLRIRDE